MKSFKLAALGAAVVIAAALAGCSSAPQGGTSESFSKTVWLSGTKPVAKAMIGDEVSVSATVNTASLANGSPVTVTVQSGDVLIDEFATEVSGGKVRAAWKVKDNPANYIPGAYTVPVYTFTLTTERGEQVESADLDVYGWIRTKFVNDAGELKIKQSVTIDKSDGSKLKTKTDKDGYIDIKWLPLGEYRFALEKGTPEETAAK